MMKPSIMKSWPRTRKKRIVVGFFITAVAISLLVGLLWATNALGWRKWRVAEVQQFIGADLPAEAHDVQFATDNQKTRIVWLRFGLPADSDLSAFVKSMELDAELQQGYTPFPAQGSAETGMAWWTPQTAQTYSGLYAISGGKVYELLLDETDSANYIAYLRVYGIAMPN